MEENLGTVLVDLARLIRRSFDDRARDIGVTRPQWQVLTVLMRHEGINQGGLAELLVVEPITLCRMVDRLQEAELVERRRDPADRRAWRLFLTPKAKDILQQLRPLGEELMGAIVEGIPEDQQALLHSMLERIRLNLMTRAGASVDTSAPPLGDDLNPSGELSGAEKRR